MPHTARRFVEQAMPVGQFMKTISDGFYWAYEFKRDQYIGVENSVASRSEIDTSNQTVWGLNLTEANSKGDLGRLKQHIIFATIRQAVDNREQLLQFFRGRSGSDRIYEEKTFRNLTNAWRDEYCLSEPIDAEPEQRMKTAEWRITMCYYSLYKSVSAIIHTKDSADLSNSHVSTLDVHASQFLSSSARCLYGYPLNYNPSNDEFFEFRLPFPLILNTSQEEYEEQLRRERRESYADHNRGLMRALYSKAEDINTWDEGRRTSTFLHVFKLLREWANYGHGGIFSRLYGPGFIKFIDRAIQLLTYSAVSTAEVAAICAFGFDRFERELQYYREACEEGISDGSLHVDKRFDIYQRALSNF
jgi:hypothetical protein